MKTETVGIASIAYYIPSGILTSEEMAKMSNLPVWVFTDKIGIEKKAIAAEDEHPSEMGIKSALQAINKAGITPEEIGLIAFCGAGDYDYRFWSPAAKIQHEIGAIYAFAFEVRNFCNGGNLGIHICKNMLLADQNLSYALVVCSDKLSQLLNYSDLDALSTFTMADGSVTAVLKKGESSNQILHYQGITNGKMSDFVKIPLAGTKFALSQKEIVTELSYLKLQSPQELEKSLTSINIENYLTVINQSLHTSGYQINNVDFLLMNQIKKSLSKQLLSALGLTENHTFDSLKEYGHMGACDTLFGLAKSLELKKIKPGNLVVLTSRAVGFSWAALTLKY